MSRSSLEEIKKVSLPMILANHGILPVQQRIEGKTSYLYRAPGRADNNPSLSVFLSDGGQWLFHDFSTGYFSTNLDAMVLFGLASDWKEAARFIANHYLGKTGLELFRQGDIGQPYAGLSQKNRQENGRILSVSPLAGNALKYVIGRGIPEKIATKYLHWAKYTYDGKKTFSGIAWPTYAGGYGIRWAADLGGGKGKAFVGPAGFSFFPAGEQPTDTCLAFEGIFDFLSFIALHPEEPMCDAFVLNSVENLGSALMYLQRYPRVFSYFDNDAPGQQAAARLSNSHPCAINMSSTFLPAKDLNEFIRKI